MDTLVTVVQVLQTMISIWLTFLLVWQLFLSAYGFRRKTKNYGDHDPKSRILVLVPAHNEETVIQDIIANLQQMDYPDELYDFYIIADNCTDKTADVARSLGANVLELHRESKDSPTGKPIALQKALNRLEGYEDKYDLIMIFDADNLIDKNMFAEVNSQYVDGGETADVIQCYLGIKNRKGIVPMFYYMSFSISNRFVQMSKNLLGLNCGIGGTGFAITTRYVKERGGWTAMSLTEDFEVQIEATCEGKKVLWNHNVRIYDEKPTNLRASYRQCKRWAQGHWFVAFRNTRRLCSALKNRRIGFLEFVSSFTQMYILTPAVLLAVNLCLQGVLIACGVRSFGFGFTWPDVFISNIPAALIFVYSFMFLFYYCEHVDNRVRFSLKSVIPLLVSLTVNMIIASLAHITGLFRYKHQNQWVKTAHSMNQTKELAVSMSDLGLEQKTGK